MAKDWTDKEIAYLKRYASSKTLEQLAQRFETDEQEVQHKLTEMGTSSKDSPQESWLGREPLLETYEEALQAFHGGKRDKAETLFAKIAEECDQAELAERARQYLEICQARHEADETKIEDDFLAAVYEKNRGNFGRALEIVRKGGRAGKDDRFAYLEASVHALGNRLGDAAESLEKAIELDAKNRVYAFHDPDFAALRKSSEHAGLFRAS